MRFSTVFLWVNVTIIGASPLYARSSALGKSDIDDIEKQFPGIYWKLAADTCTDDEFEILYKATEMSSRILEGAAPSAYDAGLASGVDNSMYNSAAWNRYFISPQNAMIADTTHSWSLNPEAYQTVLHNMMQAAFYPTQGGKKKNGDGTVQAKQAAYTCQRDFKGCAQEPTARGGWTGPSARTSQPDSALNTLVDGALIAFCPRYFQEAGQKHIEDYVNDLKKVKRKMSWHVLPSLRTFEHVILHEWMHVNLFGYGPKNIETQKNWPIIVDVSNSGLEGVPDEQVMYGDYYTYEFARKYHKNSKLGAVNLETALNADSYAMFYLYSYLSDEFDWDTDGSETLHKRDADTDPEDKGVTWTVDDDDDENVRSPSELNEFVMPTNCIFLGKNSTLDASCTFDPDYADDDVANPDLDYQCDTTQTSSVPADIFGGMYGKFCDQVDEKSMLTWVVDNEGNEMFTLDKRTPPTKPSDYETVTGYLSFSTNSDNSTCSKSCSDAFDYLKACPCGTTGQGMYSMAQQGSVDVGCGVYTFNVNKA